MLSNALNLSIAMIMVHAVAGKISSAYIDFAQLASNRLIDVISSVM